MCFFLASLTAFLSVAFFLALQSQSLDILRLNSFVVLVCGWRCGTFGVLHLGFFSFSHSSFSFKGDGDRRPRRANAGNLLGNQLIALPKWKRKCVTTWLIFRGEILFDVNHDLGPHALRLNASRKAALACFDELRSECCCDRECC